RRREALLNAVRNAADHGLPVERYNPDQLIAVMKEARSPRAHGAVEAELTRIYLTYARDLQTGILTPKKIDSGLVRDVPLRDRTAYLKAIESAAAPNRVLRALAPTTPEYARLMKAKLVMTRQGTKGGWGATVPAASLKPEDRGQSVVALRNRLMKMGYLQRSASRVYDEAMSQAVQKFQVAHGLTPDGVAGAGTIAEINKPLDARLQSVLVAMERERWLNRPEGLGDRHVWVNLTDFTARIMDNGKLTFETRSVIGKNQSGRHSPEFSDIMEHMVINPTWHVPRSIATKEYLPLLKRNPNAVSHLRLVDSRGRTVNRGAVNFNAYSERSFPFNIKQPPSSRNALGLVKFMFPNKYNIYLHDTPAKNLFSREMRAYSHGCIRLAQPFDFAYELLSKQEADPVTAFKTHLNTGRETKVLLEKQVPVHIVYRTAFTSADGRLHHRKDIYGRDAKIWNALRNAGVALPHANG
ncbi:MAG: L,D-transpeptidase family protein, partial [Pseudomonadota bacterium]